jgi:polyisoprenoid-binding protein YceI
VTRSRRTRRLRIIAIAAVVVVALLGFAAWWFVFRDDAPPPASLVDRDAPTTLAGAPAGSADGTWTVHPGRDVFAGYRIDEQFAGDTIEKTAVGRSPAVTGTFTVQGSTVPAASIDVDLTELKSDSGRRDREMQQSGLELARFPSASFRLTQPVVLPGAPALGQPVSVPAVGELTLHGVTKPVTVALTARWNGDSIDLAGQAPVVLADYGIRPPSIGGFVSVDDRGAFEVQLTFTRT